MRLLEENRITDVAQIKGMVRKVIQNCTSNFFFQGTGIRGMLTKGDVLAFLGRASGPTGTFKDNTPTPSVYKSKAVIAGAAPPKKV
jgi:hypothetical protein